MHYYDQESSATGEGGVELAFNSQATQVSGWVKTLSTLQVCAHTDRGWLVPSRNRGGTTEEGQRRDCLRWHTMLAHPVAPLPPDEGDAGRLSI